MRKNILFFLLIVLVASCGIQLDKRRYNKGYYVHCNSKSKAKLELTRDFTNGRIYSTSQKRLENSSEPETKLSGSYRSFISDEPEISSIVVKPLESHFYSKSVRLHKKKKYSPPRALPAAISNIKDNSLDSQLYGLAGSIVLISYAVLRSKREKVLLLTQKAHKNSKLTRIRIWAMQTVLLLLGFFTGKNIHALGYSFSETPEYVYGGLSVLGFGSLFANRIIAGVNNFRAFYLKKLSFLILGTCFFASSLIIGNKAAAEKEQVSPMGHVMTFLDSGYNKLTGQSNETTEPLSEGQRVLIGFEIFGCMLLGIILIAAIAVACCAAICSIVFATEDPVLYLAAIGFALIASGLVFGLIGLIKLITKLFRKLRTDK